MYILQSVLFALIFIIATPVFAFDGNRQGFSLGLGLGVHKIDLNGFYGGENLGKESLSGNAYTIKLGGGLSDQFSLNYIYNVTSFKEPFSNGITTRDITYHIELKSIGGTYYFSRSAPSVFIYSGVGIVDLSAPRESNTTKAIGNAALIGVGYELVSHLTIEACYLASDIGRDDDPLERLKASSIQAAINYVFY